MKKSKFILPAVGLLTAGSFAAAISCTPSSKQKEESKEIIIAVDGVQKEFYDEVIKLYEKTESAKKFKIKTFQKDVWGALDINVQGINSKDVADIFYMPADRVTDFTQSKKLAYIEDFIPELFEEVAQKIGATKEEIDLMKQFGTIRGRKDGKSQSKLMAIRHNTEGLILASRLSETEAANELKNASTDTLQELVVQGKALLRFQDFWFGNGVLAGAFEKIRTTSNDETLKKTNLMQRILYTDAKTAKITSGFIKTNQYHDNFKSALKVMAGLFYPIYEAAYLKSESDFSKTVWGQKGITQGDLKEVLSKDVGNAQAKIFSLMTSGKTDYTVIGSWDTQNAEKSAKAQSFFNVVKTDNDNEYLQGPGAWAYGINSRNNGSSPERKQAFKDLFKAMFEVSSYKEYFKKDSKIPFSGKVQQALVDDVRKENETELNLVTEFAKSLGFKDYDALRTDAQTKISEISSLATRGNWGNSWSAENDKTAADAENNQLKAAELKNEIQKPSALSDEEYNGIEVLNILPLRNTVAYILGVSNVDDLVGKLAADATDNQQWLVGNQLLKENALKSEKAAELKEGAIAFHMRKVEKFIFGANGDSGEEKEALIQKLTNALLEDKKAGNSEKINTIKSEVLAKAKEFISEFSKNETTITDENLTRVVDLYLNTYLNPAKVRAAVLGIYENSKYVAGKEATFKEVDEKITQFEKKLTFNKLLKVFSSTQSIAEGGLGVLKAQKTRPDNSNPQFTPVWGFMNDQTFGNAELYKQMAEKKVDSIDKFVDEIANVLSQKFDEVAGKLNVSNSTTSVEF
ncbi:Lipoprotein [Mycoplasmopsis canis UFG4]|uniref:Lipoprotein n=1 Tax=Mycoplasmopsis canis UFG4 TaxID=1131455 RepID=I1A792_9BACT|nr:hypothetical protein [Mycoplasmopsis canis]EIE42363.1 Lipoprotein [Mycoplasmopsis canis UFG4]